LALLAAVASEDVPEWAQEATKFAANVSVGLVPPECDGQKLAEIGAKASLSADADKGYVNFEASFAEGMESLEKLAWTEVPPPADDADLPDGVDSKEDLWDTLGLDGKESLTLKFRLTKEHFSMAIILENAPSVPFFKDGKTLCIVEKVQEMGDDIADAVSGLPVGFGLHDEEPHPHRDEKKMEEEIKGVMPKDKEAAEKALVDEVKKDVKKGGDDKMEGEDAYTIDADDLIDQLKGELDEVPKGAKSPFTVEVFTNQTTGKPTNVLLVGTEDDVKGARLWVNFTKLTFENVTTLDEPVCKDGQSVDEVVGALMPPPERRLLERAVKLRALESINGALSVVRTLRPRTKVPLDATKLWNAKDLEAAKMERYLMRRMKAERLTWRTAYARYQRKSQIMLAGSGLLLTVMGLALFVTRCRRSGARPSLFEPLPPNDSEMA